MPFGGGSGAGVSISPIAFIVVQQTGVKLLSVEHSSAMDKLLDLVPDIVDKVNVILDKQLNKIENKNKKLNEIANNVKVVNNNQKQETKKQPARPTYETEYDETDM